MARNPDRAETRQKIERWIGAAVKTVATMERIATDRFHVFSYGGFQTYRERVEMLNGRGLRLMDEASQSQRSVIRDYRTRMHALVAAIALQEEARKP